MQQGDKGALDFKEIVLVPCPRRGLMGQDACCLKGMPKIFSLLLSKALANVNQNICPGAFLLHPLAWLIP